MNIWRTENLFGISSRRKIPKLRYERAPLTAARLKENNKKKKLFQNIKQQQQQQHRKKKKLNLKERIFSSCAVVLFLCC